MGLCLWTDHPSRLWGRVCIAFYEAGATTYTYQRLSYDIIDSSKTILRAGFESMIGLERVPQLELSLNVRSQSFGVLLNLLRSGYVLVRVTRQPPSLVSGKFVFRREPYQSLADAPSHVWTGVVNSKLEVDLIKDDNTRLVVDEAAHWCASECTYDDLYAALITRPDRISNIDDVYEIHRDSGYVVAQFDGKPIREIRHWPPRGGYVFTRYAEVWRSFAQAIASKYVATFPFFSSSTFAVITTPLIALNINGSLVPQSENNFYLATDYDPNSSNKYWGVCEYVKRTGSLRDALKELAETLLLRVKLAQEDTTTDIITIPYFGSLTAVQYNAALTSRKLFAQIISSVTVTADNWGHERIKEFMMRRDHRYNDYGVRLAITHTVPWGKQYLRQDNANEWRATPTDVDYSGLRNMYVLSGGKMIRPWLIAPYVDAHQHVGQIINKHGRTFNPTTSISPNDNSTYLLAGVDEYSLRNVVARSIIALMGDTTAELRTYRMQDRDYFSALGYNNGYGYMLGAEMQIASGVCDYTHYRVGSGYAD